MQATRSSTGGDDAQLGHNALAAATYLLQTVRLVHHLAMWAILAFMIHHVYAALLIDHIEKNARDGGMELEEMLR